MTINCMYYSVKPDGFNSGRGECSMKIPIFFYPGDYFIIEFFIEFIYYLYCICLINYYN